MRALSSWVLVGLALTALHCGSDDGVDDTAEDDLTGAQGAGITKGSPEERAILNLVNDLSMEAGAYQTQVKVTKTVANGIMKARSGATTGPEDDKFFRSVEDVDKITGTGAAAFTALKNFAVANNYDLAKPNLALLMIPDNLGRNPTSNDVQIFRGYDGRKPEEVLATVRARLGNPIDASNERFFRDTVLASHKSFTIGLGNFFAPGSPTQTFLQNFIFGSKFTLLGTMSALRPTILKVETTTGTRYFQKASPGGAYAYEPLEASVKNADGTPRYPIIMTSKVRQSPAGVYVEYPQWKASVFTSPITP